jgi:hypothetical protein
MPHSRITRFGVLDLDGLLTEMPHYEPGSVSQLQNEILALARNSPLGAPPIPPIDLVTAFAEVIAATTTVGCLHEFYREALTAYVAVVLKAHAAE